MSGIDKLYPITGKEIRQKFIDYFVSKGHTHVASSSLVPYNDATLLFTNAGMVQFKDLFLGLEKRPYTRAVTAQRCVRAGGKHNDLDTVGRTARHHTFFEMLGNFSFGDYFKRDAITFAWEFITDVMKLNKEHLYVTVFEKDDEAEQLWQEIAGLPLERIYRIGAKDNFWAMGDTGPCGPCSEIFYDRGEKYRCDAPECGIGKCDCDRYMEIWNLVFMQYDRSEDGTLTPLPRPSIDTGMGLERLTSIMQETDSNYDTDLMAGIIAGVETISGKKYDPGMAGFPFRVIADHARSCTFLIGDGVMPSNDGRGYVLRRILRRAVRFGKSLGLNGPFLCNMVPYVCESLGEAYPEVLAQKETIMKVIRIEEERFNVTLQDGLVIAEEIIAKVKAQGGDTICGKDAFTLYDTYGFPVDLTKDIAEENGLLVDEAGFVQAMEDQREKARQSRQSASGADELLLISQLLAKEEAGQFTGYQTACGEAMITKIIVDQKEATIAGMGQKGWLVLDTTPFYGESGGQVGDGGFIQGDSGKMLIEDTQKLPNKVILHKFQVVSGEFALNEKVLAQIDEEKRKATARNHSATHLLQKALRDNLGEHVHQTGSFVNEERMRFDFSHFTALTQEELVKVENQVNDYILADMPINCTEMPIEEAKSLGAMAFFGDKYGDIVRVVKMGDCSMEFCGGTHCSSTGEIGFVKILSETGIAAGMRRIEMITGKQTLAYYQQQEKTINEMASSLKTLPGEISKKVAKIVAELKEKNKEIEKLKAQLAQNSSGDLLQDLQEINGLKMLAVYTKSIDNMSDLRTMMDNLRQDAALDILILAAKNDEKVFLAANVSAQAQAKGFHAGNIIKEVAAVCGGSGGGKADMAQAGGKDISKIGEAIDKAWEILQGK